MKKLLLAALFAAPLAAPALAQDFGATGGRDFSVELGLGVQGKPAIPAATSQVHGTLRNPAEILKSQISFRNCGGSRKKRRFLIHHADALGNYPLWNRGLISQEFSMNLKKCQDIIR